MIFFTSDFISPLINNLHLHSDIFKPCRRMRMAKMIRLLCKIGEDGNMQSLNFHILRTHLPVLPPSKKYHSKF